MISNDIDIDHWRRQLAQRSRVQIPDVLQPEAAEALADELSTRTPWQLAERSSGESRTTCCAFSTRRCSSSSRAISAATR